MTFTIGYWIIPALFSLLFFYLIFKNNSGDWGAIELMFKLPFYGFLIMLSWLIYFIIF
jgi:hypothetical protein